MKRFVLLISSVIILLFSSQVYAVEISGTDGTIAPASNATPTDTWDWMIGPADTGGNNWTPASGTSTGSKDVTVIVTEKVPGATCFPEWNESGPGWKKYKCTIGSGFSTIQAMFGWLIKYATFLTALIGMLMVVFSGFQYATSAGDGDSQKKAVIRIQKLIGGLVLLFLTGFILNTIAPWIYK